MICALLFLPFLAMPLTSQEPIELPKLNSLEAKQSQQKFEIWRNRVQQQTLAPFSIEHSFLGTISSTEVDGTLSHEATGGLSRFSNYQSRRSQHHRFQLQDSKDPQFNDISLEFLLDGKAIWFRTEGYEIESESNRLFSDGVKFRADLNALENVFALGLEFMAMVPEHPEFLPIEEEGIELAQALTETIPPDFYSLLHPTSQVFVLVQYFQCVDFNEANGVLATQFVLDDSNGSILKLLMKSTLSERPDLLGGEQSVEEAMAILNQVAVDLTFSLSFEASSGILLSFQFHSDHLALNEKGEPNGDVSISMTYQGELTYPEDPANIVIPSMPLTPGGLDASLWLGPAALYLSGAIREMEAAGDLDF